MTILEEIKESFRRGSSLTKLIYINIAAFVGIYIIFIFFYLFNITENREEFLYFFLPYFAVPSNLSSLLVKPWTLLTYMFLHYDFIHILFNLLWLYIFGRIFLQYLNGKKLTGVYILGGLSGALLYIAVFNIFPVFSSEVLRKSIALGASASVMAIVIAISVYVPNYKIYIPFIGPTKIMYIALIGFILTSVVDISSNTGGKIAHIGGALFGYFYIVRYRKGIDMTRGINRILDWFFGLFKSKPKIKVTHRQYDTDMDYRKRKADEQAEIDRILDKIAKSGYDSLTSKEKDILFKQSKK